MVVEQVEWALSRNIHIFVYNVNVQLDGRSKTGACVHGVLPPLISCLPPHPSRTFFPIARPDCDYFHLAARLVVERRNL